MSDQNSSLPPSCAALVEVLLDPCALEVFAHLVLQPRPVDDIPLQGSIRNEARRAQGLDKLVQCGVVHEGDDGFSVDRRYLAAALATREIPHGLTTPPSATLKSLFSKGQLLSVPFKDYSMAMKLCAYLADIFTPGEIHTEKEVTAALGEVCNDPIGLRRLMVECEALVRTADGAQYQRPPW